MEKKIKLIIADDNIALCELIKDYLQQYENIEILACIHTDEEEINKIDELKPDIVITDLMRNHKYSALEIIKKYKTKKQTPKFLIISAAPKDSVNLKDVEIDGYIVKPFLDYSIIIKEINRIAKNL